MAWRVVKDHLEGDDGPDSDVGRGQWGRQDEQSECPELPFTCKLYDDDGELYYTVAYDAAAERADMSYGGLYECYKWGEYWAGATDLRIKGKSLYG